MVNDKRHIDLARCDGVGGLDSWSKPQTRQIRFMVVHITDSSCNPKGRVYMLDTLCSPNRSIVRLVMIIHFRFLSCNL
jgi:hypothetical protein